MTRYDQTFPTGAGVYAQLNYLHPLGNAPYVYIDDFIIMQMISGPGSVEVPLLHVVSHDTPADYQLTAFHVAVQWVRYHADFVNLTASFVRIHSSGISHDWMRKQLVEELGFVAVPQPGGDFVFQYSLRQKGADNA